MVTYVLLCFGDILEIPIFFVQIALVNVQNKERK